MIKKYQKKPIVVEAVEFDGFNFYEIARFTGLTADDMDIGVSSQ